MKINYNLYPGRERKEKIDYEEKDVKVSIITPYYNTNKYIDSVNTSPK